MRSCHERGSRAPKRSRISAAHSRRAARIFATSSKKSMWQLKKNEKRGRKRVRVEPAVDQLLHVGHAVGDA